MATIPFNPAAYGNNTFASLLAAGNQRADQQNQQNIQAFSNLVNAGTQGYLAYDKNQRLAQFTDPNTGVLDQKGYLANLAQTNPMQAQAERQQFAAQQLENQKTQADINQKNALADYNKAKAQEAESMQKINNVKSHKDGSEYLMGLITKVPEGDQNGFDKVVSIAKNAGFDVSEYEGQKFTPELKQNALDYLIGYNNVAKNLLEAEQNRISQQNANSTTKNANTASDRLIFDKTQQGIANEQADKKIGIDQQNANTAKGRLAVDQQQADTQALTAKNNAAKSSKENEIKSLEAYEKVQGSVSQIQNQMDTIDKIVNNPELNNIVGKATYGIASRVPRSDTAQFDTVYQQLKGQNFLTAIQQMRGLGALSEIEGAKAQASAAALDPTKQSPAEFKKNLAELQDTLQKGLDRSRNMINKYNNIYGTNNDPNIATRQNSNAQNNNQGQTFQGVPIDRIQQLINAGVR